MPLAPYLAWKFLREGKTQTWLIVAGAAVGVAVVVFLSALITAVGQTIVSQTLDVLPHVVVRPPEEVARALPAIDGRLTMPSVEKPPQRTRSIVQWQRVEREIAALPHVIGVSPAVTGPAFASRGAADRSITLLGVDPARFAQVIGIAPRMKEGELRLEATDAVIGVELASELGVLTGDRIRIGTADGRSESMLVAGLFDLGNRDVNRRWVLVSLRNGQTLLDLVGGASNIDVRVDDIWAASDVASRIAARSALTAESWMTTNAQLMIAVQSQARSSWTIELFIAVAVAMGIASVLVVSVVQRSRQIGILRAMGIARGTIERVFLIQGAAVGLVGAVIGSAAGAALALVFERGSKNPDGSPTYVIHLPPSLFASALALATITGVLAALVPARRASRLDPAEAMRQ